MKTQNRIPLIEAGNASEAVAGLYAAVQSKLGLVPNMVKALGNSESALKTYLGASGAVAEGTLRPALREKIALLVAELNQCDYCLSAHTAIGGLLQVPQDELTAARSADARDAKERAVLQLTRSVVETKGAVPDEVFQAAQSAGVTDEEAAEVVANVAVNVLTNYFNRFARTDIDFPKVEAGTCGEACACSH